MQTRKCLKTRRGRNVLLDCMKTLRKSNGDIVSCVLSLVWLQGAMHTINK